MRVFSGLEDLRASVGEEVGISDWIRIDQDRIDLFAASTNDHQWLHIDAREAALGPYGSTIAHGFLTLSLMVPTVQQLYRVEGQRMVVNYGVNKVRFPDPVPVNSIIRGSLSLTGCSDIRDGAQLTWRVAVERGGFKKPVCVAEYITRVQCG